MPASPTACGRWPRAACRRARLGPSLLLHPLDFLGAEDAPSLAFFPAMRTPADVKLRRVQGYLEQFASRFDVKPMGAYADAIVAARELPIRAPDFRRPD